MDGLAWQTTITEIDSKTSLSPPYKTAAMTDILFGQSYFLRFDAKMWQMGQPYPPLGTLYAASALRERGYDVALFDATLAPSEEAWAEALDRHQARYAILYEDQFNYFSKMCLLRMREAAFTMIRIAKAQGCEVIVSGSDATDHAPEYHRAGADYVIVGEGEETLADLMDRLAGQSQTPVETLPGLALPGPEGGEARTPARSLVRDLDQFPFPAWDLVDMAQYRHFWRERHGYFSLNMVTTRGCPYRCNWCAKPVYGQRYSVRSPESVAEELALLKREYQPDHIWFGDDIFGLKPGWIGRFADRVREQDAVIPFKCQMRADLMDAETVAALKAAGCRTVWMGAESGSQQVLDRMDKDLRVEQIHEAAQRLRSAGIEVCFFLQFGYPGEAWEDIRATLRMVRACRPDDIGISVSYPLPGTEFYERVQTGLGEKRNWNDSGDLAMLYRGTYAPDFYRQLHTTVHRMFRAQKAFTPHTSRLTPHTFFSRIASGAFHAAVLPFSWARLMWLRRKANRPTFESQENAKWRMQNGE